MGENIHFTPSKNTVSKDKLSSKNMNISRFNPVTNKTSKHTSFNRYEPNLAESTFIPTDGQFSNGYTPMSTVNFDPVYTGNQLKKDSNLTDQLYDDWNDSIEEGFLGSEESDFE
jgi:hypothetical protein